MSSGKTIAQALQETGLYVGTTKGVSMEPLFRDSRDTIVIVPPTGRLKKYDVPLYRRGDDYVLHRVIKVNPDSYVICGDNCLQKEYGITDEDIVGVLTEFYRKDKHCYVTDRGYRWYARIRVATHPLRVLRYRAAVVFRNVFPKQKNQ